MCRPDLSIHLSKTNVSNILTQALLNVMWYALTLNYYGYAYLSSLRDGNLYARPIKALQRQKTLSKKRWYLMWSIQPLCQH